MGENYMVTVTLAVSEELKRKMETHPEINWSEVARQAFLQKLDDMEFLRKVKETSKLTEQDAIELGAKINRALAKRYLSKR